MSERSTKHLYPQFEKMLGRSVRETKLGQRSHAFWLYGLSGSGKSTLAIGLEQRLFNAGYTVQVLDGDNIRSGLNRDLGFSAEDRQENIRRIAEVAKLFVHSGIVTIASFITPLQALRDKARAIVGKNDFTDVYIGASYDECARRDPKGLYAKVHSGKVQQFTGKDSEFEPPEHPDLFVNTENETPEQSLNCLFDAVMSKIQL